MTEEETRNIIDAEMATAHHARQAGNEGMVRVCSRRAARAAIAYWLQSHPEHAWGMDAIRQLNQVRADGTLPAEVREAALHLTARVDARFSSPFTSDPIEDCRVIVNHFLAV